jgi:hypothetical protein
MKHHTAWGTSLVTAAHTISKNRIKPSAEDVFACGNQLKVIKELPFSYSIFSRRIEVISHSIGCELIKWIKIRPVFFFVQADVSWDVGGHYSFLCVCSNQDEGEILTCKLSPILTRGEDIFNLFDLHMVDKDRRWEQCVDICKDNGSVWATSRVRWLNGERTTRTPSPCPSSEKWCSRSAVGIINVVIWVNRGRHYISGKVTNVTREKYVGALCIINEV